MVVRSAGFFAADGAATLVTWKLKLAVVTWLLDKVFPFSAFAVLVIFQPELRRMLSELGNLPLFYTASEQRENIEVIIQTVERLAEVKIGALIAIRRRRLVLMWWSPGIIVDCGPTT